MKRWEVQLRIVVEADSDDGHLNVEADIIDAVAGLPHVVSVDANGSAREA